MKPQIAAVVLAHDQPDYLSVTLQALANQTLQPDSVLVIDSSTDSESRSIAEGYPAFEIAQIDPSSSLKSAIDAAISNLDESVKWVWLLHDDSAPEKSALAELVVTAEKSPSVALVGPKQLSWQNPREILQLGLTLAPNGDIFSPITGELDQSQHDDIDDVFAISTAGALVSLDAYKAIGGLAENAPALAADLDLSIRARLAGHRVLVSPRAKVVHAALSLSGQRPKRWLRAQPRTAARRAEIHLKLNYAPPITAFFFWFFLPVIGLARSITAIATKQPQRILSEVSASIWGWFTIFARVSGRGGIKRIRKVSFAKLAPLRATWSQIKESRLGRYDYEPVADSGQQNAVNSNSDIAGQQLGFFASGGLWFAAALLLLNFTWWPNGIAASGGGVLPLAENWLDLFNRAGASFQDIGLGYYAPSDPFVWVLATLGLLTFWAPSLSVAILLFAFKSLAFVSAWRLAAELTRSTWARNVAAFSYAVYPYTLIYQSEARLPALIAFLLLPIFVLATLKVAGLTARSSAASAQQRVTWLAVAGLALAALTASLPIAGLIALIALAIVALVRIKRLGYLLWIPLPTAAIFGPTVLFYALGIKQPLGLLADPGLPQATSRLPLVDLNSLGLAGWPAITSAHASLLLFVVALAAILFRRIASAAILAISAIVLLAISTLADQVQISAVGVGSTTQSEQSIDLGSAGLMAAVAVITSILIGWLIDGIKRKTLRNSLSAALVAVLATMAIAFVWANPSQLHYSDGRAVPSIVAAEAKAGSDLKLLSIRPSLNSNSDLVFAAELVNGDGVQLEDVSLSYRFAVSKISTESTSFSQVAQLVADLASGTGGHINSTLQALKLGYVLISDVDLPQAANLAFSLDSIAELESVGKTEFGQLWRVREPAQAVDAIANSDQPAWSITKGVQLAIILSFALMALPSRDRRRSEHESEIFVDENEDANV